MVRYIGKHRPPRDEVQMHLQQLEKLMKKYKRIGVFCVPDGGKTRLLEILVDKYEDSEWTIFTESIMFNDGRPYPEPFVFAFIHPDLDPLPNFEIIYTLQYSTEYKEAVSGIQFTDGFWRPIGEYMRYAQWYKYGQQDLRKQKFKSIESLRQFVN